jgi:hypothetical protein
MHGYLVHAQQLIEHGLTPSRAQAFQAWGTYALLAGPAALFGGHGLVAAALLWAVLGAAAVPMTYLLACRVCSRPAVAAAVGVAALLWYPNLAYTGLFLSETPFLCLLIAAVWRLVVLIQDGRGALGCGILGALCFAVRPEVGLSFVLIAGLWIRLRKDHPAAGWRHVGLVAAPLALVFVCSLWHFHRHTGRWGGIAESARANLTPARCHHPWVETFATAADFQPGRRGKDGRVYGVVFFYELLERGSDGPFALRPVFGTDAARVDLPTPAGSLPIGITDGGVSLQYVGHRADPEVHAALQRACIARAGWREQLRISVINLSGLWFFNSQWPDTTHGGKPFLPWSNAFIAIFQWLVWLPSLIGVRLALRDARTNPGLAVCALPLIGMMIVAAVWFGSIRLRTPYDPLALLLAAETWVRVVARMRDYLARTGRSPGVTGDSKDKS